MSVQQVAHNRMHFKRRSYIIVILTLILLDKGKKYKMLMQHTDTEKLIHNKVSSDYYIFMLRTIIPVTHPHPQLTSIL